jgi:indole-3-acetate monooxygenase
LTLAPAKPIIAATGGGGRLADTDVVVDSLPEICADIRARALEIEQGRRLPADLTERLRRGGVFRLQLPRELGGAESDPVATIEVLEALAGADGSAGWCAMIGAATNAIASFLPESGARSILGSSGDVITGGKLAANGQAVAVEGGYRLSGRWDFGSGGEHCDWLCGGAVVTEAGSGPAQVRIFFVPVAEVQILDTWDVAGLCGTGSHDFTVSETFVPADHTLTLDTAPWCTGPLWRIPILAHIFPPMAAVPLGIARAALDELTMLATDKIPYLSSRRLAERDVVQAMVARAEAGWRAGRAFLFEAVTDLWETVLRGDQVTMPQRAIARLATVHAAQVSIEAVDACFKAGGSTSIYRGSLLQRAFRDVHVATQHTVLAYAGYETAGRVLLGLPPDTPML